MTWKLVTVINEILRKTRALNENKMIALVIASAGQRPQNWKIWLIIALDKSSRGSLSDLMMIVGRNDQLVVIITRPVFLMVPELLESLICNGSVIDWKILLNVGLVTSRGDRLAHQGIVFFFSFFFVTNQSDVSRFLSWSPRGECRLGDVFLIGMVRAAGDDEAWYMVLWSESMMNIFFGGENFFFGGNFFFFAQFFFSTKFFQHILDSYLHNKDLSSFFFQKKPTKQLQLPLDVWNYHKFFKSFFFNYFSLQISPNWDSWSQHVHPPHTALLVWFLAPNSLAHKLKN